MVGAPATRGEWDNTADAIACCTTVTNDTGGAGEGSKDAASHSRESHHAAGSHLTHTRLAPVPIATTTPQEARRKQAKRSGLHRPCKRTCRPNSLHRPNSPQRSSAARGNWSSRLPGEHIPYRWAGMRTGPAGGTARSESLSAAKPTPGPQSPQNPREPHGPSAAPDAGRTPPPAPALQSTAIPRFRDCAPDRKAASALCAQRNARHNHL